MRRLFAWLLLLAAAFFVLTGIIDLAVGPELQAQETGESGARWYGAIYLVIGVALGALGYQLDRRKPKSVD